MKTPQPGTIDNPFTPEEIASGAAKLPTSGEFHIRVKNKDRPIVVEGTPNEHLANAGWHGPNIEAQITWKITVVGKSLVFGYEAVADNPLFRQGGPRGHEGFPRSVVHANPNTPLYTHEFPDKWEMSLVHITAPNGHASSGSRDLNERTFDITPDRVADSAIVDCKFYKGDGDKGEHNKFTINLKDLLVLIRIK